MERLTEYDYLAGVKTGDLKAGVDPRRAFDRLAAYEDTGLEPEDLKKTECTTGMETMTVRIILKSGESFFVNCTEFKIQKNGFGQIFSYKIDGITSGKPLFLDLSQVAAIVRV